MTNQAQVLENPLKEGLTMNQAEEPCAMVILGAHGDLTKRKLVPALYALATKGLLPPGFCVVGLSRTKMTDEEFRQAMKDSVQKYSSDAAFDSRTWDKFAEGMYYLSANFGSAASFNDLSKLLGDLSSKHGTRGNVIFYMATPPSLYGDIVDRLAESGLSEMKPGLHAPWPRIIVEKPFGRDLGSAVELDAHIHKVFDESQVFRIDHYLGKETVQNIIVLRFANGIFEPLWNRQHIDHVQITNAETLGVEGRISYYEEAGNLRDMIQNHMLQLVSLVAMEPPVSMDANATRDEKAKVLRSLRPADLSNGAKSLVRGQYGPGFVSGKAVPGYRQEEGVNPQSATETFTALKLFVDNWRWADVPFYVRSGKRLGRGATEIAIHFKRAPLRLFNQDLVGPKEGQIISPNVLVIQIQPDEGLSLKFATKQPGPTTQLRWLSMDFKYGSAFGQSSTNAYERLVHDCIMGDASLFARTDEAQASWTFISPILEYWAQSKPNFPNYDAGSWGPQEAHDLLAADGRAWRML